MLWKCRKSFLLVVFAFGALLLGATRDVTVFRLQIAAFDEQSKALAKATETEQLLGDTTVSVEYVEGDFPFKVRFGYFNSYARAKAAEKDYEANHGSAFVVSEVLTYENALLKGISVPLTFYDADKLKSRHASGMSEEDLYYNANIFVNEMHAVAGLQARVDALKDGLQYLIELAEVHDDSSHAAWARYHLGTHYLRRYYLEKAKEFSRPSLYKWTTVEAMIDSARENFEYLVSNYPESSYAERSAYQVASLTAALRWGGVQVQRMKRGLEAYEKFLEKYPQSSYAAKAKMNIGAIQFEMAKSGRFPMEGAYQYLADIISATDVQLKDFERGRTMVMMAEIQEQQMHNHQLALDILQQIDTGPNQDRKTAATVDYLKAQAYRGLGDLETAANTFLAFAEKYGPEDMWESKREYYLPSAVYAAAECQRKMGMATEARENYQRVIDEWPDNAYIGGAEAGISEIDKIGGSN